MNLRNIILISVMILSIWNINYLFSCIFSKKECCCCFYVLRIENSRSCHCYEWDYYCPRSICYCKDGKFYESKFQYLETVREASLKQIAPKAPKPEQMDEENQLCQNQQAKKTLNEIRASSSLMQQRKLSQQNSDDVNI